MKAVSTIMIVLKRLHGSTARGCVLDMQFNPTDASAPVVCHYHLVLLCAGSPRPRHGAIFSPFSWLGFQPARACHKMVAQHKRDNNTGMRNANSLQAMVMKALTDVGFDGCAVSIRIPQSIAQCSYNYPAADAVNQSVLSIRVYVDGSCID